MANEEISVIMQDYAGFCKFLNMFSIVNSSCRLFLDKDGARVFGKSQAERCDLFTSAAKLAEETSVSLCIGDLPKLLSALKTLDKHYKTDDATLFSLGEISLFVSRSASYVRIASRKFNLKYQLQSSAVVRSSQGPGSSDVPESSKYAKTVHPIVLAGKNPFDELDMLAVFRTTSAKLAGIPGLISTLSSTEDVKVEFDLAEQAARVRDLFGPDDPVMENGVYAVVSDSSKLVGNGLGNRACCAVGEVVKCSSEITLLKEASSMYNMRQDQLTVLSRLVSAFQAKSRGKDSEVDLFDGIELGVSKENLMHANFVARENGAVSALYVTFVGAI